MKLSHLRLLSWTLGVTLGLGLGFGAWSAIAAARALDLPRIEEWKPLEPDTSGIMDNELMSEQDVTKALTIITQRALPPAPVDAAPAPPPPPPPKPFTLKLAFIAFDEKEPHMSMAFITDIPTLATSPFFEKDDLFDSGAKLKKIYKTHVEVLKEDGTIETLSLENVTIKPGVTTASNEPPVLRIEAGPPPAPAPVLKPGIDPLQYRTEPATREVVRDESYGIDIIKYDSPREDIQRYAITEKDRVTLDSSSMRLLTEVSPELVRDDNGQVTGIKALFAVDNPLLAKYGVLANDVLTHINDVPVTSVDQAMKIYKELTADTRRVKLTIQRNKQPMFIFFEMDDFPQVKPPAGAGGAATAREKSSSSG